MFNAKLQTAVYCIETIMDMEMRDVNEVVTTLRVGSREYHELIASSYVRRDQFQQAIDHLRALDDNEHSVQMRLTIKV
jgi:hypothetical protein